MKIILNYCVLFYDDKRFLSVPIHLNQTLQVRRGNSSNGFKQSSMSKRCGYRNLTTFSVTEKQNSSNCNITCHMIKGACLFLNFN